MCTLYISTVFPNKSLRKHIIIIGNVLVYYVIEEKSGADEKIVELKCNSGVIVIIYPRLRLKI